MNSIPTDTILVLGNGFDLDLGLKTSYSDFIQNVYLGTQKSPTNKLINDMIEKYNDGIWSDIELFLREYAISYNDKCIESGRNIPHEYKQLCQDLNSYMHVDKYDTFNQPLKQPYNKDSTAAKVLSFASHSGIDIYSFNYTDLTEVQNALNSYSNLNIILSSSHITYVHGKTSSSYSSANPPIILGIDDIKNIKDEFQCMVKLYSSNITPNIITALKKTKNVIFFGLSFGITDFPYFTDFFQSIHDGNKPDVKISLFTKGDSTSFYKQVNKMITGSFAKFKDLSNISIYDTSNPNCFNEFQNNN